MICANRQKHLWSIALFITPKLPNLSTALAFIVGKQVLRSCRANMRAFPSQPPPSLLHYCNVGIFVINLLATSH